MIKYRAARCSLFHAASLVSPWRELAEEYHCTDERDQGPCVAYGYSCRAARKTKGRVLHVDIAIGLAVGRSAEAAAFPVKIVQIVLRTRSQKHNKN